MVSSQSIYFNWVFIIGYIFSLMGHFPEGAFQQVRSFRFHPCFCGYPGTGLPCGQRFFIS